MDDMKQMILDYIRKEYIDEDEADDVTLDENTKLISSGIVDSFSMVSLKRFLEKKYAISIPDGEATPQAFDSVMSIIGLVRRFRKEA
jgi:acyl carrier protein